MEWFAPGTQTFSSFSEEGELFLRKTRKRVRENNQPKYNIFLRNDLVFITEFQEQWFLFI